MKASYCYWTVVNGPYAAMAATLVQSARQAGVFKDFHVWSDQAVDGATVHAIERFDSTLCLFKFLFLFEAVRKLPYDYFIWLDADSYFVRNPGDVLRVLSGAPVHATLESDACRPDNQRTEWWGCPLAKYAGMMRALGVKSRAIFNVNAGFWIVHHDVIETFCELCFEFWSFSKRHGSVFTEEAPLAYATQMLCGDPYIHTLRATSDAWASDWTGVFSHRLPDGQPRHFEDYFSGERIIVNPAIVHAMRAKELLSVR